VRVLKIQEGIYIISWKLGRGGGKLNFPQINIIKKEIVKFDQNYSTYQVRKNIIHFFYFKLEEGVVLTESVDRKKG
jgi:hypothetical protein